MNDDPWKLTGNVQTQSLLIFSIPREYLAENINGQDFNKNIKSGQEINCEPRHLTITRRRFRGERAAAQALRRLSAAEALISFRNAAAELMDPEQPPELDASQWLEIARQAFETAATMARHPAIPEVDQDANLGDISMETKLAPGLKVLSRVEVEKVASELIRNEPDDFGEFMAELLNRLFGRTA